MGSRLLLYHVRARASLKSNALQCNSIVAKSGQWAHRSNELQRKLVVAEGELREDVVSLVSNALQQVPVTMSSR